MFAIESDDDANAERSYLALSRPSQMVGRHRAFWRWRFRAMRL